MSLRIAARSKHAARDATPSRLSLTARLTLAYALSTFALVLLVSGAMYWALADSADRLDDQLLLDEVDSVRRAQLGLTSQRLEALKQQVAAQTKLSVRLLDIDGLTLVESRGMGQVLMVADFPMAADVNQAFHRGTDFIAEDGRPYRIMAARAAPIRQGPISVVQVAFDRTHTLEIVAAYRNYLGGVLAVALVLGTLAGRQIARQGVRPFEDIADTARRVRTTAPGERLIVAGLPRELADLAGTFNAAFDAMDESFARLSMLSSDMAQALRAPLEQLRQQAQAVLSQPEKDDACRGALAACVQESLRLERMVDGLLEIAGTESPQAAVLRDAVDVGRELSALAARYEAAAERAGVRLAIETPAEVTAHVSRPLFERAVGNLLENALEHTPRGGSVHVTTGHENGELSVQVSDTGCGIAQEHLAHVFDRFYRVEGSPSTNSAGVGLGLAIVRSIATLHEGSVRLTSEVGRGTTVVVSFPRKSTPLAAR